jgi:LmbE family N-acetylglucosaminyl deacetylase
LDPERGPDRSGGGRDRVGFGPGTRQLLVAPPPSALVVGEVDPAVDPTLERLGCAVLRAGLETAVETATERGALHVALLSPELLESERGLSVVAYLRQRYPSARFVVVADPERLAPTLLLRALRSNLHNIADPADAIGLHTMLAGCVEAARSAAERVLAIGAHPDDVEIGCAGSLLDHRRRGDDVTVLTLSRGEVGGEMGDREQESVAAASAIGAQLILADLPDTRIDPGIETIRMIESVAADVRPTIVYVHSRNDNHQDHRAINLATMSATRRVPQVYAYQSPSATNDFTPTHFVPIDTVIGRKVEVLGSFTSQRERSYLEPELVVAGARYWARHLAPLARFVEPFEVVRSFARASAPAAHALGSFGAAAPVVPMPVTAALHSSEGS